MVGEDVEKLEHLYNPHCCWICKMVQELWKTVGQFLQKLNLKLAYDPEIILLGNENKSTQRLKRKC